MVQNKAIDISAATKFIKYFLNQTKIFLTRIMTTDIFVMTATKAVPPYSRARIDGKVSAVLTNQTAGELDMDRFAKYSIFNAGIESIL
jgi:hypothetical protein